VDFGDSKRTPEKKGGRSGQSAFFTLYLRLDVAGGERKEKGGRYGKRKGREKKNKMPSLRRPYEFYSLLERRDKGEKTCREEKKKGKGRTLETHCCWCLRKKEGGKGKGKKGGGKKRGGTAVGSSLGGLTLAPSGDRPGRKGEKKGKKKKREGRKGSRAFQKRSLREISLFTTPDWRKKRRGGKGGKPVPKKKRDIYGTD